MIQNGWRFFIFSFKKMVNELWFASKKLIPETHKQANSKHRGTQTSQY
jgi:hypothetical protein